MERLIAAEGVIADPAVRLELAEDLTARALDQCVPLVDREGVPEHIRSWTSRPVLAVEADLRTRFAARADQPPLGAPRLAPLPASAVGGLDPGRAAAVAAVPERYRARVLLQAGLGLRIGELLAFRVQNADLLRRSVRIE